MDGTTPPHALSPPNSQRAIIDTIPHASGISLVVCDVTKGLALARSMWLMFCFTVVSTVALVPANHTV